MAVNAMKRVGNQWVQDPDLKPEVMVTTALDYSPANLWLWPLSFSPFKILPMTEGNPGVDPLTGHYHSPLIPDMTPVKLGFGNGSPLRLISARFEYDGPKIFHTSQSGQYDLRLFVRHPPTTSLLLPLGLYTVLIHVDKSTPEGRRPHQIQCIGRLGHSLKALQDWSTELRFDFSGSYFPERNTHLKPSVQNNHEWQPDLIEVTRTVMTPQRRRVQRRNLGSPKD